MKFVNVLFLISTFLILSCEDKNNDEKEKEVVVVSEKQENPHTLPQSFEGRKANILEIETSLKNDSLKLNKGKALLLIRAYEDFVFHHKHEDEVPEYLFKTGELYWALSHPKEAISNFNQVIQEHPKADRSAESLFFKAMLLEDALQDSDASREAYEQFISKYPKHPLVKDAKASIALLGKSLEEIVAGFEK